MNYISKTIFKTSLVAVLGLSVLSACTDNGLAEGIKFEQAGEFDKAYAALLPVATKGDKLAQHKLGVLYMNGTGINKSDAEAFK